MTHITKRASTGALVTHDHERRGAFAEALANIGAGGFLTNRVQIVLAQNTFDVVKPGARGRRLDPDPVRFFQALSGDDLDWNSRGLGLRFLLLRRIVGGG